MNDWRNSSSLDADTEAHYDSLSQMVYQKLKEMIVKGEMFPGTPLREADLSKRLGVSRTPVREALRMLRSERLVQSAPHCGAHVAYVSRQEILDAYDVREWLEPPLAARAALVMDKRTLQLLRDTLEHMSDLPLTHSESIASEHADARFHEIILDVADNTIAKEFISRARAVTKSAAFFVTLGRHHRSKEEHMVILEAMRQKNAKAAETAMRQHIALAKRRILPVSDGSE